MKRISLFLSCLFAAVSVFAGNLSGLLNKVGVEYDYDYVFVTNIADNSVKLEGTLNDEALAVEGLAVQVMVDGKVVGDATISNDTIAYAFAGTYAQEDVIQANLLFKYNAGQTVTSGINYVVAYETQFIVTVPDGTEGCYLVFTEQGLEKAVEMEFISLNAFSAVVPFNAWGKEYYYSLKAEEDFYEVDLTGAVISRIYAGQTDTVEAWNQICVPYYELVLNDTVVVAMELEGASYSVYDLELEEGATLQIREHLKDCTDSITNIIAGGDEPLPYKLLEGNLALMQLAGTYDVVFDVETRELVLNRHNGNLLYLYKNYTLSDINAKPYAGFNAAAERVDVDEFGNYYLQITTGSAKTAVAGLVGNAYNVSYMKQVVENPSALVFDYKNNIEGTKTLNIVKTAGDPALAEPVFSFNLNLEKTDDWKTVVIYLDEWLADKSVLAQENEGDSYYILLDIASDNGLQDGELDIRDMYYAPYIKYSVTVPEGTEVCYLKNEIGLIQMENDAPNHYTLELYDVDRYSQTYNYCAGEGDEFIEVDATGAVLAPRYYHAEDEVVAWKNAYCSPKYGYAMNDQLVQFAETDGGNLIIEKQVIAEEDSAYYIINMCTEDTMKAAEVPAIAGEYKIELVLADTSVIFTKIEPVVPVGPITIFEGEADLNNWSVNWSLGLGQFGDNDYEIFAKAGVKEGQLIKVYIKPTADYWAMQFFDGSWNAQKYMSKLITGVENETDPNQVNSDTYDLAHNCGIIEIPVSAQLATELTNNATNWGGAWILQGNVIVTKITLEEGPKVIYQGEADLNNWSVNWSLGLGQFGDNDYEVFAKAGVKEGQLIKVYIKPTADFWALQFFDGSWNAQKYMSKLITGVENETDPNQVNSDTYDLDAHGGAIEIPVSAQLATELINNATNWGGGWILQGNVIVTKITLEEGPKVIYQGEADLNNWSVNWSLGLGQFGDNDYEVFAKAGVFEGQAIRVYITPTADYWALQFFDGSWNAQKYMSKLITGVENETDPNQVNSDTYDLDANGGAIEIPVSAQLATELINNATNWGGAWILQGNVIVTKITLGKPSIKKDGPAEECFEIVDEAFNALDENASISEGVMTFAAANSAMNMWLGGIDLNGFNTLTIEYEATTDFQVLLQDTQGEEQFVASADTNIVVYHYLADVDMAKLLQFIFVAQEEGTVKLNSICFSLVEYPTYYLGNKWDGAEEVSFREMSNDNHGDWFVTGVLGSDEVLLAFEAEPNVTVAYPISEIAEISGKELLIGDEVEFHCYEYLGNIFEAEVLARPTYVKHPWKSGEWTWAMMTRNEELHQWEYTGIWGGQGFNINAAGPYDNGALWFAANDENVVYITTDGEIVTEPAVGTEVTICYQDNDTKAGVRYTIATGLNSVKDGAQAIKLMENGQMFIIRDGKTYNIVGACVRNK